MNSVQCILELYVFLKKKTSLNVDNSLLIKYNFAIDKFKIKELIEE